MKGRTGQASTLLHPILDSYMDAAVGVVGCSSRGIDRYSCEFDIVVVTADRLPPTSLKYGDVYVDATFVTDKDVLKPASPEHSLSLAYLKPVRDASLLLSTAAAASAAVLEESASKASRTRLATSLKALGRAEASLAKEELVDADFWLLDAAYEFAYALLYSRESLPSPSHLLAQLRASAAGLPQGFEGVSMGAGLEAAGRAGCGARLEGVGVLHDLLRETSGASADSGWSDVKSEIMAAKARELMTRIELAECYSYLGQELVEGILAVQRIRPNRTLTDLTAGTDRLLGERVVRQLGLAREKGPVQTGIEILKKQVASLSKG